MNFNRLWTDYKEKLHSVRPFLNTKTGSKLTIAVILDFVFLFFAPLMHEFVGTALFGCVVSVYLILLWRKYDSEHAIVPAVILCIPMLLDMLIYSGMPHPMPIIVGLLVSGAAILFAALSPMIRFFDRITDTINSLLVAGVMCVVVVVFACIMMILVDIAWWILCIIAFIVVVAVFLAVVFSTAAYTASDGRRQANKQRRRVDRPRYEYEDEDDEEDERESREERYRSYRPRRDNTIYNLDDDDFRDIE